MASNKSDPRTFRIEGSGMMLNALAEAIERSLRRAGSTPDRTGSAKVIQGPVTIEVTATNYDRYDLKYSISNIEDAVRTVSGWAEPKRCDDCDKPVALLFDDAYLETPDGDGVVCCRCWRRREGDADKDD
jgi:hypothetical protein